MKSVLSILMPVYNARKYLSRAVHSILTQSFNNFELIIINDGSNDGSDILIEEWKEKDSRINTIDHVQNIGKVAAVNQALSKCTGKYITIHDADDFSLHNRLERQIDLLERTEYVMCGTSFYIFNHKNSYIDTVELPSDYDEIRQEILNRKSCFHGPTMIFRKDIINLVGGLYRMRISCLISS
jgi:glycosyltransferase involved in cell wall biosynthesis